ncbi:MAG: hypothetical protein ACFHU9_11800 [Fluviicola sp.]
MNFLLGILITLAQLLFGMEPPTEVSEEEYPLSDKLKEISGLELLNDSTLIAFNDGGNKSEIYLLSLEGEILRTVNILDTKNRDWEDIAIDNEYVYIGDIGNNNNDRDSLAILRIKISDILNKEDVEVETIKFRYKEQKSFPPEDAALFYDAEGMSVCNDSIWIFTKDRSKPFQGLSLVYKIPLEPGEYEVSVSHRITIGYDGWWKDGVTAADYYNGQFYLLTYNRYIIYDYKNGSLQMNREQTFDGMTQRESLVVLNEEAIFVADEQNPIVGNVRLYKVSLP